MPRVKVRVGVKIRVRIRIRIRTSVRTRVRGFGREINISVFISSNCQRLLMASGNDIYMAYCNCVCAHTCFS